MNAGPDFLQNVRKINGEIEQKSHRSKPPIVQAYFSDLALQTGKSNALSDIMDLPE